MISLPKRKLTYVYNSTKQLLYTIKKDLSLNILYDNFAPDFSGDGQEILKTDNDQGFLFLQTDIDRITVLGDLSIDTYTISCNISTSETERSRIISFCSFGDNLILVLSSNENLTLFAFRSDHHFVLNQIRVEKDADEEVINMISISERNLIFVISKRLGNAGTRMEISLRVSVYRVSMDRNELHLFSSHRIYFGNLEPQHYRDLVVKTHVVSEEDSTIIVSGSTPVESEAAIFKYSSNNKQFSAMASLNAHKKILDSSFSCGKFWTLSSCSTINVYY